MKQRITVYSFIAVAAMFVGARADAAGMLMPKDTSLPPLAVKSHRITVKIKNRVAHTHIEQVFVNHTNRQLEATFIFPMPEGSSISDFAMWMKGKRVSGEVLAKVKARKIYNDIVRRMQDPALLEYLGDNLFKASIFPIPPNGEQKIELDYTEVVHTDNGLAEYRFPMRTGERASTVQGDFSVLVEMTSKEPITNVYSPSHDIEVVRKSDTHIKVSFEEQKSVLNRDFRMFYTVTKKAFGLNLITSRTEGEDGYFLLMLAPRTEIDDENIIAKDVCFVIDSSGSMSGKKMEQARESLRYCVNSLRDKDRFAVVRFSTEVSRWQKKLVLASKANRAKAAKWIGKIEARGGTNINDALDTALKMKTEEKRPFIIVFMTDGLPTIGVVNPDRILKNVEKHIAAGTRIFSFGVGDDVNTKLLDGLASRTRATSQYVAPEEDIEVKVSSFFDKVRAPVLAAVKVDLDTVEVYDRYPRELPDIFMGSQMLVFGRYRGDGHIAVRLSGEINGDKKSYVYEGTFAKKTKDNEFIGRLWATRKVGYLLSEIRANGEIKELVDEVVALSQEHGIMTPYTSYLVTEDTAPSPRLASARQRRSGEKGDVLSRSDRRVGHKRTQSAGGGWGSALGPAPAFAVMEDSDRAVDSEAQTEAIRGPGTTDNSAPRPPGKWLGGKMPEEKAATAGVVGGRESSVRLERFTNMDGEGKGKSSGFGRKNVEREYHLAQETRRGLSKEFGKDAVDASRMVNELKNKDIAGAHDVIEKTILRRTARVGKRAFELEGGVWTHTYTYKGPAKTVTVKYMSDAYFKILERQPDLKKVFALGKRIKVLLDSRFVVVVAAEGKEDLTDAELDELFPVK